MNDGLFWTRARRHPSFVAGLVLSAALFGAATLSLVWTPYVASEIDIPNRLAGPSLAHGLGTDSLGRDIVSQLLEGAQNAILVGVLAVALGLSVGVSLGLLASARRGWVEELIMRLADLTFAFPALLTAIMLGAVWGPGVTTGIVAMGVFMVPVFARTTRAAANTVWGTDYVLAARAAGQGPWAITWQHVVPNIMGVLIVQATVQFALAFVVEAALSYLGLGTQPPKPSWGRMLNEAQQLLFEAPQLAVWPGAAIALSVLGLNLLGDGLRDLLDPKLARQRTIGAPASPQASPGHPSTPNTRTAFHERR
jgi:peptide/nickel transport system permease protein